MPRQYLNPLARQWARTLHIMLSMVGLALIVFFAATGFLLNHEEWFGLGERQTRSAKTEIPTELLVEPDKLGIVEHLRAHNQVSGAVTAFNVEDDLLTITFKGPGRQCDVTLQRETGEVSLEFQWRGTLGRITELHRGVDAGPAWRLVVDATAVLLVFTAITGLILWSLVPKWRAYGLAGGAVCVGVCFIVYLLVAP
jgi:hypothetical protein